jgi:hypothetical protein
MRRWLGLRPETLDGLWFGTLLVLVMAIPVALFLDAPYYAGFFALVLAIVAALAP